MDCFICKKHKTPEEYIGQIITEKNNVVVTHFPFLPDEKATSGHLIIEPRRHITELSDMNDQEAQALGLLIRSAAKAIKSQLGAEHVYVFRINDKVAHLHFHLVPRYPGTPKEFWGLKIMEWPERPIVNLQEIYKISESLKIDQ